MTETLPGVFKKDVALIFEEAIAEIENLDAVVFSRLAEAVSPTWQTVGTLLNETDGRAATLVNIVQTACEMNYTDKAAIIMEKLADACQQREEKYHRSSHYVNAMKQLATTKLTRDQRKWVKEHLASIDHYAEGDANATRLFQIESELTKLTSAFNDHYQRSLNDWVLRIENRHHLSGLRDELVDEWYRNDDDGNEWWTADLSEDIWLEVLETADHPGLRRAIHYGYTTLGSDLVPSVVNNIDRIEEILKLRHEYATLLEHQSFASYTLSSMSITDPNRIIRQLKRLDKKVNVQVQKEWKLAETLSGGSVHEWDIPYYMRQQRLKSDLECDLLPYLHTNDTFARVLDYFSSIFDVTFTEHEIDGHQRFFEVTQSDEVIGYFYTDIFRREEKLDMCCVSKVIHRTDHTLPTYIYILNFEKFMHHRNLITMLHEFGHLLHGLLNKSNISLLNGYDSLGIDAVEFMSQFMENFAWHKPTLRELCRHNISGGRPSDDMLDRLLKDRTLASGIHISGYIKKSLADLLMHHEYDGSEQFALQKTTEVSKIEGTSIEEWSNRWVGRFHHTFGSIAGYESAYYIYIWSELFARDAFEPFTKRRSKNGLRDEMNRFVDIFLKPTRPNFQTQFRRYMGRNMKEETWSRFYGFGISN